MNPEPIKQEEHLDIVNEKGEVLRSLPRSVVHGNPKLLHRVVHALIFTSGGNLILQKRPLSKDVAPGKWDTSVGGHVSSGESIEEALEKEMAEELGISGIRPDFLYKYIHSNEYESEMVFTYKAVYDDPVNFDREEIDTVKEWTTEDIQNNLGKKIFSDNFEHEYSKFQKNQIRN